MSNNISPATMLRERDSGFSIKIDRVHSFFFYLFSALQEDMIRIFIFSQHGNKFAYYISKYMFLTIYSFITNYKGIKQVQNF